MLQKGKSFAINSSDAKLTESFKYLYKHVQEMSISAKKQTAIESYFRWCSCNLYYNYVASQDNTR